MSLYDVVFESRDQRMGTHRGKTHSSGHPLAPIKDGFSTGRGTSSMGSSAWARAQRDNEKKTERQTAKKEIEREATPTPARKPIFKTGKTDREREKDQAKAWFGGDKASMERTKKLSKWTNYITMSRERSARDARARQGQNRKPLTPEEADKTLKLRKREDKRAARLAKWADQKAEKQRKQKELAQTVFSALKANSSPVISSSLDLGREPLMLEGKWSGRPEDRAAWREHVRQGIELGNRADRAPGEPLYPNRHKIDADARTRRFMPAPKGADPKIWPAKMRTLDIAAKLRQSKRDADLTKRGDERLKDLASIDNYRMTGPVNPALRLRHTGRDKKVVSRAIEKLKLKKRD